MVHLSERLYKCNMCAETCGYKNTLDEHIKTIGPSSPTRESTSNLEVGEVGSRQVTLTNNLVDCSLESDNSPPQNSRGTIISEGRQEAIKDLLMNHHLQRGCYCLVIIK